MIYPENIGKRLSIDEVALSQGELYTVVTNKKAKGRAGSIVAIIEGTKAEVVIEHINKISVSKRRMVKEITLDMANSMKLISKKCFPQAVQVTDRFHVQKLCLEAVQEIRIKHRWKALDEDNEAVTDAKAKGVHYTSPTLDNGDTKKQLLARGRYLLYKSRDKWTENQKVRSEILFEEYPEIKEAYNLSQALRQIYNTSTEKGVERLAYNKKSYLINRSINSFL